jgi:hypothetical protein
MVGLSGKNMDTVLPVNADLETIRTALQELSAGESIACQSETVFSKAKLLLVKEKITGVSIQLVDSDGYVIRQVTGKRRSDVEEGEFSDRQQAVIRALEKVLRHCKQEGVRLVGYSDELVAYPARCKDLSQASVYALDVDTQGVYTGADSDSTWVE